MNERDNLNCDDIIVSDCNSYARNVATLFLTLRSRLMNECIADEERRGGTVLLPLFELFQETK